MGNVIGENGERLMIYQDCFQLKIALGCSFYFKNFELFEFVI